MGLLTDLVSARDLFRDVTREAERFGKTLQEAISPLPPGGAPYDTPLVFGPGGAPVDTRAPGVPKSPLTPSGMAATVAPPPPGYPANVLKPPPTVYGPDGKPITPPKGGQVWDSPDDWRTPAPSMANPGEGEWLDPGRGGSKMGKSGSGGDAEKPRWAVRFGDVRGIPNLRFCTPPGEPQQAGKSTQALLFPVSKYGFLGGEVNYLKLPAYDCTSVVAWKFEWRLVYIDCTLLHQYNAERGVGGEASKVSGKSSGGSGTTQGADRSGQMKSYIWGTSGAYGNTGAPIAGLTSANGKSVSDPKVVEGLGAIVAELQALRREQRPNITDVRARGLG
ncbi:MAG TPA: hypothetical protein PLS95_01005 [Thermoanaerobaculales bacterium]|jgi:hypothetical protein|nr:hypothetical protein [Thermoanaerobaculales bacterium]